MWVIYYCWDSDHYFVSMGINKVRKNILGPVKKYEGYYEAEEQCHLLNSRNPRI